MIHEDNPVIATIRNAKNITNDSLQKYNVLLQKHNIGIIYAKNDNDALYKAACEYGMEVEIHRIKD